MLRFVFVAALLCFNVALAQDFVSMVNNCRQKHLDRNNECLAAAVMKMRPRIPSGIPELNLPPMDPFALDDVNFIQDSGPVQVRAKYANLLAYGLSKFEIKYFDWNFQDEILYLGVVLPSVTLKGKYNITGRLFELPIVGEGAYSSQLQGLVFNSKSNLGVNSAGKVIVKDTSLDFDIKHSTAKMDNLFEGNQVLSETMHHFLRENNAIILEEVKPELSRQLGNILGTIIRSIVGAMPSESLSAIENDNLNDRHRKRTNELKAKRKAAAAGNNSG